jgi:hypothetical protein
VHLYLASKIAIMKADEPEAKKAREELIKVMASLRGTKSTPSGPQMGAKDVLTLVAALYSLQSEGKELLRSGNEKGMKPILPFLFEPNAKLLQALDLNMEHAFLLSGLFVAKFHPDTKVPVPDEIALYEAWMTNADTLPLQGLVPLIRAMKGVLYGNNGFCDLVGKEGAGAERDAGKLTGATLGAAFTTVNGSKSNVTEEQAKKTLDASRALLHGAAALCYKKRDKGDDEEKFINELDAFLRAADDLGVRSSETVFIRAYVSIRRGKRDEAKKHLETVRDDPKINAATKEDVDKLLAHLNDDVDVWLNTPRRPWEACGTSGMKVLVNGGLNLSELDGWWAEVYTPEVGWALGDGKEHDHDPAWDAIEAEALYDLLEREVIPEFYTRDEQGISTAWVARMRESMARLTPRFSTNRAVCEYTEQYYVPAAAAYRERAAGKGEIGVALVDWRHALEQKWTALRFGEVKLQTTGEQHVFEVQVYLDELDPELVRIELYANGVGGAAAERVEMQRLRQLVGAANGYAYRAEVPATRPVTDYTARVLSHRDGVAVPLEDAHILWQR